jgi:mRNA interferase RelE/StbE
VQLIGYTFSESSLKYLSTVPHKLRAQIIKKAKALIVNPYPQGSKKLQGMTTEQGEAIYRERSGDYRILYVVKNNPTIVVILDIDHRKDIYQ